MAQPPEGKATKTSLVVIDFHHCVLRFVLVPILLR